MNRSAIRRQYELALRNNPDIMAGIIPDGEEYETDNEYRVRMWVNRGVETDVIYNKVIGCQWSVMVNGFELLRWELN